MNDHNYSWRPGQIGVFCGSDTETSGNSFMVKTNQKTLAQKFLEVSKKNIERKKQLRALNKAHKALWAMLKNQVHENNNLETRLSIAKQRQEDGDEKQFRDGLSYGFATVFIIVGMSAFFWVVFK